MEADSETDAELSVDGPHGAGEGVPLMVRLGAIQEQERSPLRVMHQGDGERWRLILLPVILGEDHRRTARAVVDQRVDIEPGDLPVLEGGEQMRGEQPSRRARVDEAVEVIEQHNVIKLGHVVIDRKEVCRVMRHVYLGRPLTCSFTGLACD